MYRACTFDVHDGNPAGDRRRFFGNAAGESLCFRNLWIEECFRINLQNVGKNQQSARGVRPRNAHIV